MRSLALSLLLAAAAASAQEAPKVVKLEPDDLAFDIDAKKVKKMVVTFDRTMRGTGWSFCGGGPNFPEFKGKPSWKDPRTCEVEVALEPDHSYELSLNCPAATNFRADNGVPLAPTPWRFATLPAKLPDPRAQRAENKKATEKLKDVLERSYSYYDRRIRDWPRRWREHERALLESKTTLAWAAAAGRLLAPTEDIHLHLRCGERFIATGKRAIDPLYRAPLLKAHLDSQEPIGKLALAGRTKDGIGYLMIAGWVDELDLEGIERELTKLADCQALVIDVRPNSGGNELLAQRVAQWFVSGTRTYGKNRYRTGKGPDAFGPILDRQITGNAAPKRFDRPIAVLTSRYVMSSCESFVLMLRQAKDCTVVGQPTYGSSGNPKAHELPNGVTIVVPSWQDLRLDGTCFEGEGLAPDVLVEFDAKELERRDPILERALELLRKKVGG